MVLNVYVPLKEYQALRTPFHFKMFSVASKVFAAIVYSSERHSKKRRFKMTFTFNLLCFSEGFETYLERPKCVDCTRCLLRFMGKGYSLLFFALYVFWMGSRLYNCGRWILMCLCPRNGFLAMSMPLWLQEQYIRAPLKERVVDLFYSQSMTGLMS